MGRNLAAQPRADESCPVRTHETACDALASMLSTINMLSTIKLSFVRSIGIFIVVLGMLIGGTWGAVKITTDDLLYQDATSTARDWARYLAENVVDLEHIAGGEQPSNASMTFFQTAHKSGQ